MATNINFSFPSVPRSVTNPLVRSQDALDRNSVFSFIEFIKNNTVNYDAVRMQAFYNNYVTLWADTINSKSSDSTAIIRSRYIEFLRDVSLTYTTNDERKFLSNIDFNDDRDIQIAASFYSSKLKYIIQYYRGKRESLKYNITRFKLKGSNLGTQKNIQELVVDHLANRDDLIDYNIDDVINTFQVDIQELYNGFNTQYNQIPDEKLPGYVDLDFGENIFLRSDDELVADIFSELSDELKNLREVDDLFENKRELTRNSMGSNYHFLSSNGISHYVTGSLFDSSNSVDTLANREHPTLAVTEHPEDLLSKEDIGFFRPSKTSFITMHADVFNFTIDLAHQGWRYNGQKLPGSVLGVGMNPEVSSLLFFPDPILYGNDHKVFTFSVDSTTLKRSLFSGVANNQPNTSTTDINAIGYASDIDPLNRLGDDLDYIYDQGYIDNSKLDVFGNSYGLIKNENNFRPVIQDVDNKDIIKSLLLDGHDFHDELYSEGYTFDYSVADSTTYTETIRSGISAYTNSFDLSGQVPYTLFFRLFTPYEELKPSAEGDNLIVFSLKDGAFFEFQGELLPDAVSSDRSVGYGTGIYYYTQLLDGGIANSDPFNRALVEPTLPGVDLADFTQNPRDIDDVDVLKIDGGRFTDNVEIDFEFINSPDYVYLDDTSNITTLSAIQTAEDIYNVRVNLGGNIYVKNVETGVVLPLLESHPYFITKYANSTLLAELSSSEIVNFDIQYTTLFIQTKNTFVIDKPRYIDGVFNESHSNNVVISYNDNLLNNISNRFKTGTDVTFFTTTLLENELSATNNAIVYPSIYQYNYNTEKTEKIFPKNDTQLNSVLNIFSLSGGDASIIEISTPTIVYNSVNNLYNLSWIGKDQNKSPNIFTYIIEIDNASNVDFISANKYTATDDNYSNIFDNGLGSLVTTLSSGPPTIIDNTFIL